MAPGPGCGLVRRTARGAMLESPPHPPWNRRMSQALDIVRNDILAAGGPLRAGPRVHARPAAGALRGRGGSLLPVDAIRRVGARGRHRETGQPQHRAGRRGAGGERREERVRVLRRARIESARARRVGRAQHRPGGRRRPHRGVARLVRAGALPPPSTRSSRSTRAPVSPCWSAPMRRRGGSARTSSR